MSKINANNILNQAIVALEIKRATELEELKLQFEEVYERMKPSNQIKNLVKEITESPNIKNGIGNSLIGIVSGYVAKSILFGSTANPIKIIAGILTQTITSNLATKNVDKIKWAAEKLSQLLKDRAIRRKTLSREHEPYK